MGVPKYIKDAQKNPVGKPLAFKSPKELQEKIDEYFAYCDNKVKQVYNKELGDHILISNPEPYTVSGLGVWLGVDRHTIVNYGKKEEYFTTIKKARARVEADVERRMNDKETFTPGLIFNAKNNFGWVDKAEVDHTSKGERMGVIELPSRNVQHNTVPETTGSSQPDSV